MKNRIETKNSIRQKSREIIKARAKRRKKFLTAVTSASLCFAAMFFAVRICAIQNNNKSECAKEAVSCDGENETAFANIQEKTISENTQDDTKCYGMPDRMKIYTAHSSEKIYLSAENADEWQYMISIDQWIRELDTKDVSDYKDSDEAKIYAVERIYGDKTVTVYIQKNMIKFNDGIWLEFPKEQTEKLDNIMAEISKQKGISL